MIIKFKEEDISVPLSEEERKIFSGNSKYLVKNELCLTVKECFFSESKKVEDRWRYDMSFSKGKWIFNSTDGSSINSFDKGANDKLISDGNNNFIIILESPHKDEYDENFSPLSPARGETGKCFFNYFISHVLPILESLGLKLDRKLVYSICFVNPIPFQTSLVEIHKDGLNKSIRDKVWKALYPKIKDSFRCRLLSYKPKVILNGCTSDLKSSVLNELNIVGVQRFDVSHPSSWQRALGSFKIV